MEIKLNIKNVDNLPDNPNLQRYEEIITALITSGGLDGVKGGQTIIHFDPYGEFKAIQLDYYPYRKRSPQ